MMSDTHERIVLIKTIIEADKQRNGATLRSVSEQARAVGGSVSESMKQAANATERALDQQTRATRKAMDEFQRHRQVVVTSAEQMGERFNSLTSDALRFARGLAIVGVSSEENMEKFARGLAKVVGYTDVIGGSIGMMIRLSRIMRDYTTYTEAAAAAQTALAAAERARAGSAVAGAAGSAGSRVVGGVAAGVTGGAVGSGGIAAVGSALAPVGAVVAVIASWGTVLGELVEITSGSAKKLESATGRIAQAEVSAAGAFLHFSSTLHDVASAGWLGGIWGTIAEKVTWEKKTERMKEATTARRADLAAREQRDKAIGGAYAQGISSGVIDMSPDDAKQHGEQAYLAALDRAITKRREELDVAEKSGRARLDIERELLQSSEKQLQIHKNILEATQGKLTSAKERFGQMSVAEQQRLISIKTKADRGLELSREERSVLRGVGLEESIGIARRGDLAAADRAGFDRVFGKTERETIATATANIEAAQFNINDQRDIIVKIEKNNEAMAERIVGKVTKLLNERDAELERMVNEKIDIAQAAYIQRTAAQANAIIGE